MIHLSPSIRGSPSHSFGYRAYRNSRYGHFERRRRHRRSRRHPDDPTVPIRCAGVRGDVGRGVVRAVRRVEGYGYSTLFATDHYFGPGTISETRPVTARSISPRSPRSPWPRRAPPPCASGVGCSPVDYHHPVVLAKELATLDLLSDGRLEVGLGAGWVAAEYEGLGVPMDSAGSRIDTAGRVRRGAARPLGRRAARHHGARTSRSMGSPAGRCPAQRPGPPIMIGGGAPKVLRVGRTPGRHRQPELQQLLGSTRVGQRGELGRRRDRARRSSGSATAPATGSPGSNSRSVPTSWRSGPTRLPSSTPWRLDSGSTRQSSPRIPTPCSARSTRSARRLIERRERYGVSYVTVAQRYLDEFAPVVAALTGR